MQTFRYQILAICILIAPTLQATDIEEVLPLTDRILVVHFDDGTIDYHGAYESRNEDETFQDPLDLVRAGEVSNYALISLDDPNYGTFTSPEALFRKSKGEEFSGECLWTGSQCLNEIVFDHWIFLVLPQAMQPGRTYVLQLNQLAFNRNTYTFTFDPNKMRSDAVHVNQIGYVPDAPQKFAYLSYWMGDGGALDLSSYNGNRFDLIDVATGNSVFQGSVTFRASRFLEETSRTDDTPGGNFQQSDVYQADFSDFTTPGSYRLCVEGIGCSYPFDIDADVYREAFYFAARSLYFERAGIDKGAPYAEHFHPADHNPEINGTKIMYTTSRFMYEGTENGNESTALANVIDTLSSFYGWYHDAGDWDGYPNHTKVPKTLMYAYELAPQKFIDNELNIPESGNGIPDILDEAFWLINYFRRYDGPTGGKFGARVHGNFESKEESVPSWADSRRWIVFGEDVWTNAEFAGLAAHMAWCLQLAEQETGEDYTSLINTLVNEAETAYQWAVTHSVSQSDSTLALEQMLYANAALYRITANPSYQLTFEKLNPIDAGSTSDNFRSVKYGLWAYVLTPETTTGLDNALHNLLQSKAIEHADFEERFAYPDRRSYRWYGSYYKPMNIGQATTPQGMASMVAYHLTSDNSYLSGLYTTADYYLGGNQANLVWLTGLGDHHPRWVLHLDSWYDETEGVVPGIVPYGPTKPGDHFLGEDYNGPWDNDYNRDRGVYPEHTEWPGHELWFDNRYTVLSNEFTVHQTLNIAASFYAYLSGDDKTFQPNQKPSGSLIPPAGDQILEIDERTLGVTASDPDGFVDRVSYYFDWHKIGDSTEPPFTLEWEEAPEGNYILHAIVYDDKGAWARTDSIAVQVNNEGLVTSIESDEEVKVSLLPNPVASNLRILYTQADGRQIAGEQGIGSVQVMSLSGQEVMRLPEIPRSGNKEVVLDMSTVRPGIYLVRVAISGQTVIKKIVKLH